MTELKYMYTFVSQSIRFSRNPYTEWKDYSSNASIMVEIAISKFLLSDPSNILKITPIGQKCYILGLIFLFKKKIWNVG